MPENSELQVRISENTFPLIVEPRPVTSRRVAENPIKDWQASLDGLRKIKDRHQRAVGAILFRGFDFNGTEDFYTFVKSFGNELLSYEFGSTPRSHLGKGVYTSTEYPDHQVIPLHNEQAYTLQWPLSIWFHCVTVAQEGGETPIADSRLIYQKIPASIRKQFDRKKLLYVRNYGNGLDVPWQQAFNTESKQEAESFARRNRIQLTWKEDGELRSSQLCQATATHPITGDKVWFNQAHLFHISNLAPAVKEMLLGCVGEDELPRNVYYGDGSPIEESVLNEVRAVINEATVMFPWQEGDVMLLDNMLVAHGRSTFKGTRKVVVAMTEPFDSTQQDYTELKHQELAGESA